MDAAVRIERGGAGDGPALAALRWAWRAGIVQTTVVLAEHRNLGVGAGLLREVVAHARERGLDYLEVHPSGRSVPFYRRMGFDGAGPALRLMLGSRS